MGAELLPGLKSNVLLPREDTEVTSSWVGENPGSDATSPDASFSGLSMTPHSLQTTVVASHKLLEQGAAGEMWIRRLLGRSVRCRMMGF